MGGGEWFALDAGIRINDTDALTILTVGNFAVMGAAPNCLGWTCKKK